MHSRQNADEHWHAVPGSVTRSTRNDGVGGSSPPVGFKKPAGNGGFFFAQTAWYPHRAKLADNDSDNGRPLRTAAAATVLAGVIDVAAVGFPEATTDIGGSR
jgi:hypothetical protein